MKNRIVLWGTDENDKKVLLGIELLAAENKVKILSFNEEIATEVFYNQLMNQWRTKGDLPLPEGHKEEIRELSVTDDLLPETLRVERTDVINRAKTEWHFAVLSSKMYEMYKGEVDGIKSKVEQLTEYDKNIWEEMKTFWSKVQTQVREKNLYREHANVLRESTDLVFDALKKLRKALDVEFEKISKEGVNTFFSKLDDIEGRIDKGLGLQPIFNELKKVQNEFRDSKFTKGDRNKVWNRLDKAFKTVKEKRFGSSAENQSAASRLERRYNGLLSAIGKMEKSIGRDRNDKSFEDRRINQSDGQLETQIRQAKVKMIEERIKSKDVKLQDMLKTKAELEKKMEDEKKREAKRAEKKEIKAKQEEMKEKVQQEIKAKQADLSPEEKAKLEKAASELASNKKPAAKPDAKAAATPAAITENKDATENTEAKEETKAPESADEKVVEKVEELATTPEATEDKAAGGGAGAILAGGGLLGAIAAVASDAIEDVVDTVKAVKEVVEDKIEDAIDVVKEEAGITDSEEVTEVQKALGEEE